MKRFERLIIYPLLIITIFLGFTGGTLMTKAGEDVIEARKINIINQQGRIVASLSADENNNGKLLLMDNEGNFIAYLGIDKNEKSAAVLVLNTVDDDRNLESGFYGSNGYDYSRSK